MEFFKLKIGDRENYNSCRALSQIYYIDVFPSLSFHWKKIQINSNKRKDRTFILDGRGRLSSRRGDNSGNLPRSWHRSARWNLTNSFLLLLFLLFTALLLVGRIRAHGTHDGRQEDQTQQTVQNQPSHVQDACKDRFNMFDNRQRGQGSKTLPLCHGKKFISISRSGILFVTTRRKFEWFPIHLRFEPEIIQGVGRLEQIIKNIIKRGLKIFQINLIRRVLQGM